jgi:hypothetical protein
MNKKLDLLVMLICMLALGLALIGCPTDSDDDGGSGNTATIIIKNQSGAPIRVELEDVWESASGSKISSGLEAKTIDANAEGTWALECTGDRAWVNIKIGGKTEWYLYDVKVGDTAKFTWDGSLSESTDT